MGQKKSIDVMNRASYPQGSAQSVVVAAGSSWDSLNLSYAREGQVFSGVANLILSLGAAIVTSPYVVYLIHGFNDFGEGEPIQIGSGNATIGTTTKEIDLYSPGQMKLADYYIIRITNNGTSDITARGRLVLQ